MTVQECQVAVNGAIALGTFLILMNTAVALFLMANAAIPSKPKEKKLESFCPLHKCDPADCEDKHD